jgi:hypothetical protein
VLTEKILAVELNKEREKKCHTKHNGILVAWVEPLLKN